MKSIIRKFCHIIFQSHLVTDNLRLYAKNVHNSKILEIGSGTNSAGRYFDTTNTFTATDLSPKDSKTLKLDLEKMDFKNIYDLVVCINVLDDIYNYQKAVDNIYSALKPDGYIFLVVNGLYPLHDLPFDYWRFTQYSLLRIFSNFRKVEIKIIGLAYFPSYYILTAQK